MVLTAEEVPQEAAGLTSNAAHTNALAAGATEVAGPHDAEGMPRCSAVKDPGGHWIWLYQG